MRQNLTWCALFIALTMVVPRSAPGADAQPSPAEKERELIAVLKSSAPSADKALACKGLAIYGGKDAASALAPFLADEQLSSWARIGLEANTDPAALAVLRDALGKLQGRLLIGVINSIGVRRDPEAVDALVEKLAKGEPEVASAAAVALGHIGSETAVKELESRLASAPPEVRPAVAEGCILCAEQLLAAAKSADAMRLYDAVRAATINPRRSVEATRGAILARGAAGVPLLLEQLHSTDKAFRNAALSTARELPGAEATRALLGELEKAAPESKTALLLVLADRGDAEALPAALQVAKSGPPPQRLAAIGLLERLGNASCVSTLMEIAADADPDLAQAARSALTRLPGQEVDAAILASFRQPGEQARLIGIELAAQRRLNQVIPDLLKSASDPSAALSQASLKALGELGGEAEIQPLIKLLLEGKNTAPIESALSAIGSRMNQPVTGSVVIKKARYGDLPDGRQADVTAKVAELAKTSGSVKASNASFGDPAGGVVKRLSVEFTINGTPGSQTVAENETMTFAASTVSPLFLDALCGALSGAPVGAKPALLRVLGSVGGPRALEVVRTALKDPDPALKEAAFGALCQWPDASALTDLKDLAQNGADLKQKVLAMRGYVRVTGQAGLTANKQLEALKDALAFAPRDDEKKLVLGALGGMRSPQAIKLILPYLDQPALKEEACVAAVAVAETFRRGVPANVAEAMTKVAQTTANAALAKRAQGIAARGEQGKK